MKAMILAAGRGERMRPLTDNCPKPLLKVNGIPLIEYHVTNLVRAGITNIVINYAWLGEQIVNYLGNGERFDAVISYSHEPIALETAGGIIKALSQLTDEYDDTFVVINGDIYTDFDCRDIAPLSSDRNAHLFLVNNPSHNVKGDFVIEQSTLCNPKDDHKKTYTFSGIAVYRRAFFTTENNHNKALDDMQVLPLAPMLRSAAELNQVSANVIDAEWTDVGTPERLAMLNNN